MKEKTGEEGNEFSVPNSIWFAVASWLLQGGDNTPRTLSGESHLSLSSMRFQMHQMSVLFPLSTYESTML